MRIHSEESARKLDALGDLVIAGAERSLDLLNAIEQTIRSLSHDQRFFEAAYELISECADLFQNNEDTALIDPEGALCEKLEGAQEALQRLYARYMAKREAAHNDGRVRGEDGIETEYTLTIEAIADIQNAVNELRWAIMEHDANREKPLGRDLQSSESIAAYIKSL